MMENSENYLKYVQWMKKDENFRYKLPPFTRTQAEFAEFIIKNYKEFNKIGNLLDIFISVQKFLKENQI